MSRFVRFQGVEPSARGIHVGVFGLVNVLGRAGGLSEADEAYRMRARRVSAYVDALDAYGVPWKRGGSDDPAGWSADVVLVDDEVPRRRVEVHPS